MSLHSKGYPKLSEGSLKSIMTGGKPTCPLIYQVVDIVWKGNKSPSEPSQIRLTLGDGKMGYGFVLIAMKVTHLCISGELSKNAIIQVNRCMYKEHGAGESKRNWMLVSDLDVLHSGEEVDARLGCLPDDLEVPPMPLEFLLQGGAVAQKSDNYKETMTLIWKMMQKSRDEPDVCPNENWNEISSNLTIELDVITTRPKIIAKSKTIVENRAVKSLEDEKTTIEDQPSTSPKPAARPADDKINEDQPSTSTKPTAGLPDHLNKVRRVRLTRKEVNLKDWCSERKPTEDQPAPPPKLPAISPDDMRKLVQRRLKEKAAKAMAEDRPASSPKPAARTADDLKKLLQMRLNEKSVPCCHHKEHDEDSDTDTDDEDCSDEEDDNSDHGRRSCHCECDCFYCSLFDSEHIHDKSKAEEARERLSQKFKDKEESKKESHEEGEKQVPNKINVKSVDNIVAFVESGDKAAAKKKRKKSKQHSKDVAYEEKVEQISDLNEKLSEIHGKVKQQENKINQLHQSGGRNKVQKISLAQNNLKEINKVKVQLEKDAHKMFGAMKELKPGVDLIEECAGMMAVMKVLVPPPKAFVVPKSDKGSESGESAEGESDEDEPDEDEKVEDESAADESAEDESAEDESAVEEQPVKVAAPTNGHDKQKSAPLANQTVSPKNPHYTKPRATYQAHVNKYKDSPKNAKLNYMDMQLAINSKNGNNFSHSPTKGVYNAPIRQPSHHNNFADAQHTKTFFSNNAPKPANQFNHPNRFVPPKLAFNSYRHNKPQPFDRFIRNYQFGPPPMSIPPPLMSIPPPPIFTKFPPPPIFNSQPMKPSAQDVENFFTFTQSQFQPTMASQNVPKSQTNFQADSALNQSFMPFKSTVKPLEPSAAFNGQRMPFNPELDLRNSSSLNDYKSSFATKPETALRMGFHEIPVPSPSAPYNYYQYLESLDEGKSSTNNQ